MEMPGDVRGTAARRRTESGGDHRQVARIRESRHSRNVVESALHPLRGVRARAAQRVPARRAALGQARWRASCKRGQSRHAVPDRRASFRTARRRGARATTRFEHHSGIARRTAVRTRADSDRIGIRRRLARGCSHGALPLRGVRQQAVLRRNARSDWIRRSGRRVRRRDEGRRGRGAQVPHHARHGGPLRIRGAVTLTSADGRVELEGGACKLCRCGASRNKPFCDGSHATPTAGAAAAP